MGIQATVVHDSLTHRPLVLRSISASSAELHSLSDTIASFTEHISALTGKVNSPIEVCARWGGPPYISYTVVAKRFRVIVIWGDEPGELDLAQDVHDCIVALRAAVDASADALIKDDPNALETVYNAAGAALHGGVTPPLEGVLQTKSSAPAPVKRTSGLRALFSRPRKSSSDTVTGSEVSKSKRSAFRPPNARAAAKRPPTPPSEEDSAARDKAKDVPFDDAPSKLHLSDAVFAWADFGDPLPPSGGDIAWIAELLGGDIQRRPVARPRIMDAPVAQSSADSIAVRDAAVGEPPVGATIPSPLGEQQLPGPAVPVALPIAPTIAAQTSSQQQHSSIQTQSTVPPAVSVTPAPPVAAQPMSQSLTPMQQPSITLNSASSSAPAPPVSPSVASLASAAPPVAMQASVPGVRSDAMPTPVPASSAASALPVPSIQNPSQRDEFDVSALGGYKDDAARATTGAAGGSDAIRGMMNEFAKSMQTGNFAQALTQVSATLRALAAVSPQRERETATCAHYSLAQKIMLRCQMLERQIANAGPGSAVGVQAAVQAAILTMFLAELKNLLPRHRLAAMRMALEKNLAVGNFGMAARWIRQIAEKAPAAQRQTLLANLQYLLDRMGSALSAQQFIGPGSVALILGRAVLLALSALLQLRSRWLRQV